MHRHRDVVVTSQYFGVDTLGIAAEDIHFSAAKLFFAYGLGNAMTFPLWTGGTAVLLDARPTPETTFATIEAFRPTDLLRCANSLRRAASGAGKRIAGPRQRASLRLGGRAAAGGDPGTLASVATGLDIVDGIGTTEILHIFISNRPGAVVPGTSGTARAGLRGAPGGR